MTVRIPSQLDQARVSAETALADSHEENASLQSRLTAATADLAATEEILEATNASLSLLRERSDAGDADRPALELRIRELEATATRLQNEVDESTVSRDQLQRRIAVLEEQLGASREELATARDAQRAADAAAQAADAGRADAVARIADLERNASEIVDLRQQLSEARIELEKLDGLVLQERAAAESAQAAVAQAAAAAEHSKREVQTLRQLGASSQAEAEALTAEANGLREQVASLSHGAFAFVATGSDHSDLARSSAAQDLEARLQQVTDQSRKNIEEVIDALQTCEQGKAAAENQVQQLVGEVDGLKAALEAAVSAPGGDSENSVRVAELEKMLEDKMVDVEEADEKLIEVRLLPVKPCHFKLTHRHTGS